MLIVPNDCLKQQGTLDSLVPLLYKAPNRNASSVPPLCSLTTMFKVNFKNIYDTGHLFFCWRQMDDASVTMSLIIYVSSECRKSAKTDRSFSVLSLSLLYM